MTTEELSGTVRVYLPSRSVAVPMDVPGTETVAPGIGWPLLSVTVPDIVTSNISANVDLPTLELEAVVS